MPSGFATPGFNGGTVTNTLALDPTDTGASALTIAMPAGSFAAPVIWDGAPGTPQELQWTVDGSLRILDPNGAAALVLRSASANDAIQVRDHTGALIFQLTDGNAIGFYGHAAQTQQTGVPVTAAAIHAALVNLGLITA